MTSNNNMHNLTTLIKRLEAATSRLEDIATATELPNDIADLNRTPAKSSATSTPPAPRHAEDELPDYVEDFDNFIATTVTKYVTLSAGISDNAAKQAAAVLDGFRHQRAFVLVSSKAKKPNIDGLQALMAPINDAAMSVMDIKENSRSDPTFNHLSAVSDGILVLGWVTIDNRPNKHIDDTLASAQFYGNKVTKDFKDKKDPKHIEWIQSFYQIFKELSDLVKQHFPTGLPWNPNGAPALEVAKSIFSEKPPPASAPTPSAGGAAPPPPPPPPPPSGPPPVIELKKSEPIDSSLPAAGLGAVFSDLNKGEAVTRGLRKVDKSQMTHKNPSLRASSTVTDGASIARGKSPAPDKKPKPEAMRLKKPSKKDLEGNKWIIENCEKEMEPVEIEASLSHSVLISRCNNTTVIIKGKANQVTIENSNRLSLIVDTLVSTVDVVKAQNFALQVMGTIPTVMLDQIDGASIFLSKESITTKVFTSKSSGINLNIISGDDDYKEVPLPSQICSYYDTKKGDLVNEIVAHAG